MIHQINPYTGILRVRGGSSFDIDIAQWNQVYSPRTRR